MLAAAIVIAVLLVFVLLPCVTVTLMLFRRKSIPDFDELKDPPGGWYTPYIQGILEDIAFMRQIDSREVSVRADDGVELKAAWYGSASNKTAILLHGFCATPLNNFSVIGKTLYERGWNLLLVWQRGHNKSGGAYTTLGVKERGDLFKWIEKAGELAPGSKLLLWGVSMGGATVAYASDELPTDTVRAMVVDCCYCSPADQMLTGLRGKLCRPLMPLIRLLSRLFYGIDIKSRTTEPLSRTEVPAAFVTGLADTTVTPERFMCNYEACASNKLLVCVPDAPHALAFAAADEETRDKLFSFIDGAFEAQSKQL